MKSKREVKVEDGTVLDPNMTIKQLILFMNSQNKLEMGLQFTTKSYIMKMELRVVELKINQEED